MYALGLILALTGSPELDPAARVIAGRPLAEWQSLINRIEPRDPDSRQFVPGLIAVMDDADVPWFTRRQAALVLGRLGPLAREAIPHVAKHLADHCADDPETSPQRWTLAALALFGREAKDVAPQLIRLLRDDDNTLITRLGCLEALSQIGSAAPAGIAAIWEELDAELTQDPAERNNDLAFGAAEALGMVGPDAASAVPVLLRAAQTNHEPLRREAAVALGRIGPAARAAQPLLCDLMLADESDVVRDAARTALSQTGPTAWPLIEPLLAGDDLATKVRAVEVVAPWRSLAETIVPHLEPLLADTESPIRLAAVKSLRSLTQRHETVWPVLLELLTDADRDVRRGASRELQAIVQTGRVCAEELQRCTRDERPQVRREALRWRRLQPDAARLK